MRVVLAPAAILSAIFSFTLLVLGLLLFFVMQTPWLGIEAESDATNDAIRIIRVAPDGPARFIRAGSELLSISDGTGTGISLDATDFTEEPDMSFGDYRRFETFFERQGKIHGLLEGASVRLSLRGGDRVLELDIVPARQRPLSSLPPSFWIQLFVGIAGFMIGGWVWSLRQTDRGAAWFFLAGAGLLLSAAAAAVYSSRELGMATTPFRLLSNLNHAGALVFGIGMIGLFLSYPRRLVPSRYLSLPALLFGGAIAADYFRIGELHYRQFFIVLAMLCILVCIALQYRATRGQPHERAALGWLGLAVIVGAGSFVLLISTPVLFGTEPPLSQGYAFLFFLLIYVGVALGILRYRLFDLEEWAFRTLFYLLGGVLLVLLDAALILSISMEQVQALGLSLFIVAFLYLPLRESLSARVLRSGAPAREDLFGRIIDVALTPPGNSQSLRWQQVIRGLFDPVNLREVDDVATGAISEEGLNLYIPGAYPLPAIRCEYAHGGRKLFNRRDSRLGDELASMLRHALESRRAYEKGIAEERARIARDMHDNIGAHLLRALHDRSTEHKNTLIRETLSDLRDIVTNTVPDLSLEEALAGLRMESDERLSATGIELAWQVDDAGAAPPPPNTIHTLRSIVRESVSNAIKHSDARNFRIDIGHREGRLLLTLEDDGKGFGTDRDGPGKGLGNIRDRAARLGGSARIDSSGTGVRIQVELPCGPDRP